MRVARRLLSLVLLGGVLVAGWRFAHRNGATVDIDLIFTRVPGTPLWVVLLVAFGVGALATGLLCLYEIARLGLLSRRYRKSVARLESEVHQLRNLPLAGETREAPAEIEAPAVGAAERDG